MATTTKNETVPDDGTPTLLVESASSVVVQLLSGGPLRIYVGPSAPADGTVGPLLTAEDFPAVSFIDLDPLVDKVYGTSVDGGDELVTLVSTS